MATEEAEVITGVVKFKETKFEDSQTLAEILCYLTAVVLNR